MESYTPEKPAETPGVSKERETVAVLAELRRKDTALRLSVLALSQGAHESSRKVATEAVQKEASGVWELDTGTAIRELAKDESALREKADVFAAPAPGYAAYLLGRIAKLKQAAGVSFETEYAEASALSAQAGTPRRPDDLIPPAQLLGIVRRKVAGQGTPTVSEMAKLALADKRALQDIALVLSEHDREAFLTLLPESERKAAATAMDREASRVLKEKITASEAEVAQAQNVTGRARQSITELLGEPQKGLSPVVKVLAQTLSELESEDSRRLLAELGTLGLKNEKNIVKEQAKISSVARIVKTLADTDLNKGGMLAMRFLAKSEVPARLFSFFTEKLRQEGYFTPNLERYKDKKNIPFLRKLIATYPGQFNTVIDTLSQSEGFEPSEHPEDVFSALEDLDSLTPIIFNRYRRSDAVGKKELARKIKEIRPKFFRNLPINDILERRDRDILAEMVYLAYKPVNISFEKVQALMKSLDDHTEDVEGYVFPEAGYDFSLTSAKDIALKKGETIDVQKLAAYKRLFAGPYPENEEDLKKASALLVRLAKAGNVSQEELASVLSIMGRDEMVQEFVGAFPSVGEHNAYDYLAELKEISEIYFKDNYGERLGNFLGANPTIEGQVMKILSNPERQETFRRKLGKGAEDINFGNLTDKKEIAKLLALFVGVTALKPIRDDIGKNLKKFAPVSGGEVQESIANLKAYISKNVGSFFAKASAGICTAEDIQLFKLENHFHINVVENDEQVSANIQAYIVEMGGEEALVLRGFNPSTAFMKRIDAEAFCERALEVGRKFVQDNNLSGLYITEQGGWHALSNRERIPDYLMKKYHTADRRMSYALKVASSHTISDIYRI